MKHLIYDELVPFYHLLDPLEDHASEGEEFGSVLRRACTEPSSLLELGAGAGHGAHYVKEGFSQVTLCDLSAPMLARSQTLNPDCEHVEADMRTMRLAREFDCVLVHDAITYMTSADELRACFDTSFAHLRPGGAALFVPDCTRESFRDYTEDHAGDDEYRSLRCIAWSHDPDPRDSTHVTDYALLLREAGEVRAVHDRHVYGLFAESQWLQMLRASGFAVSVESRPLPAEYEASAYTNLMFLGRKPT